MSSRSNISPMYYPTQTIFDSGKSTSKYFLIIPIIKSIRVPIIILLLLTGQSVIIAVNLGFLIPPGKCNGSVNHRPQPLIPCKSGPVPKILFLVL